MLPLALLAGCGAVAGEPSAAPSTVTVTASTPAGDPGQASPAASAAPSAPSSPEPSATPSGDPAALPRQERGHDVAYVAGRTDTPDGVVLSIDRLTVVGVADEQLAASGTPVRVDDGGAFTNQATRLYDVGVSPDARFFLTTCAATRVRADHRLRGRRPRGLPRRARARRDRRQPGLRRRPASCGPRPTPAAEAGRCIHRSGPDAARASRARRALLADQPGALGRRQVRHGRVDGAGRGVQPDGDHAEPALQGPLVAARRSGSGRAGPRRGAGPGRPLRASSTRSVTA